MTKSRVVVVTGGGSGIGRATAKRFGLSGGLVVVADINAESAGSVAEEIKENGGNSLHCLVDVASHESIRNLVDEIESNAGPVDVLVTCAGVLQNVTSILNMDIDENDKIWLINYRGVYLCCKEFGRQMVKRKTGSIVNISSTSAINAFPLHSYGPGKAAISQLTAILATDLGRHGVRVNAVVPGYVLTEQMQARIDSGHRDPSAMNDQSALGRMVSPGEIAEGIHFLCSDAARAITGISMPIDAGWLSSVTYKQHPGWPPKDWDLDDI